MILTFSRGIDFNFLETQFQDLPRNSQNISKREATCDHGRLPQLPVGCGEAQYNFAGP